MGWSRASSLVTNCSCHANNLISLRPSFSLTSDDDDDDEGETEGDCDDDDDDSDATDDNNNLYNVKASV